MAEQQRQSLCPRLIDYLAIVGSRSTNIKHPGNGQNPPVQVIIFSYYCSYNNLYVIKKMGEMNFSSFKFPTLVNFQWNLVPISFNTRPNGYLVKIKSIGWTEWKSPYRIIFIIRWEDGNSITFNIVSELYI